MVCGWFDSTMVCDCWLANVVYLRLCYIAVMMCACMFMHVVVRTNLCVDCVICWGALCCLLCDMVRLFVLSDVWLIQFMCSCLLCVV